MKYTHIVIKIFLLLLFPLVFMGYRYLYIVAGANFDLKFWYLANFLLMIVMFLYGLLFQWERIQALRKQRGNLKFIPINFVFSVICLLLAFIPVFYYLFSLVDNSVVSFLSSMFISNMSIVAFSAFSSILFLNSWRVREKEDA